MIISEAAAKRDFPGEQAVGRRVRYQGQYRRIVGVVGDVRTTRLTRDAGPAIYTPLRQYGYGSIGILIRARADIASLAPSIRSTLSAIESSVSVSSITPMPTLVARSYAEERYRTVIVMAFAFWPRSSRRSDSMASRCARSPAARARLGFASPWARHRHGDESADVRYIERRADRIGVWRSAGAFAGQRLSPYLFRIVPSDPWSFGVVADSARGRCAHRERTARTSRGSVQSRECLEFGLSHRDSGFGRNWKCSTLLVVPLPVSMWNGARVLTVAHRPRPFQPAFGSSMRPSIHFV